MTENVPDTYPVPETTPPQPDAPNVPADGDDLPAPDEPSDD